MKKILGFFVVWRLLLYIFLFLGLSIVPLQFNFLGGGLSNYLKYPQLWSWINFDGEHYLSIVQRGYQDLTYFYFPLYPLSVRYVANLFGGGYTKFAVSGLLLSNLSIFIALIGFWNLILLDYKRKVAITAAVLLLLFPTSFYFGSFYTESLFFAFTVWSFYFGRKKRWILAGLLGAFSTATRIVGLALFPALLIEYFIVRPALKVRPLKLVKEVLMICLIPMGLFAYMFFLKTKTGDPLEFFHSVSIFGQQRSSNLILLPQVFYRYIFKVLPNINYDYFPVVFTTWMEFVVAIVFGGLGIFGILGGLEKLRRFSRIKIRSSYAVFLAVGYLIPTLSGSFSSLPRYVLILFPAFILGAKLLTNWSRAMQTAVYALLFICLVISTMLFTRGYWIS
ncbi:hypothetical protein KKB40_05820 [Patescibacteria group bacterium]|nr:hypothetical protein [Patescibacteria group bacterium]